MAGLAFPNCWRLFAMEKHLLQKRLFLIFFNFIIYLENNLKQKNVKNTR